jgi:hypothetical protein
VGVFLLLSELLDACDKSVDPELVYFFDALCQLFELLGLFSEIKHVLLL